MTTEAVVPGSPTEPRQAVCPACGNTVYNDGLRLLNPTIDPDGRRLFRHLLIDCGSCDQVTTIEFAD